MVVMMTTMTEMEKGHILNLCYIWNFLCHVILHLNNANNVNVFDEMCLKLKIFSIGKIIFAIEWKNLINKLSICLFILDKRKN